MPPTRQQKRARARNPIKERRRGQAAFIAAVTAVLLGGGVAAAVFKSKPQPITRGAIAGEHWHADYQIEVCGKRLAPYPSVEGEIHTHGDGKMHIHPHTQAFALDNANLGNFFMTVETQIGQVNGKNFILFPNGKKYQDGDTCPETKKKEKLVVLANGKNVKGDPAKYVMHQGDKVILRFGPKATESTPNPLGSASPTAE